MEETDTMKFGKNHMKWLAGLASIAILGAACGDDDTDNPNPTPTPVPTEGTVNVRAIHLAPNVGEVDVYTLADEVYTSEAEDLAFGDFTAYVPIDVVEGVAPSVVVFAADADTEADEPLFTVAGTTIAGSVSTVEGQEAYVSAVAYEKDDPAANTPDFVVITDDVTAVTAGEIRLAGLHVAEGFDTVDVDAGDTVVFADLENAAGGGEAQVSPLTAPQEDVVLTVTQGATVLTCAPTDFTADAGYTVFAVAGDPAGVDLHVIGTASDTVAGTSASISCEAAAVAVPAVVQG